MFHVVVHASADMCETEEKLVFNARLNFIYITSVPTRKTFTVLDYFNVATATGGAGFELCIGSPATHTQTVIFKF